MDLMIKTPVQKKRNEMVWDFIKTDRSYDSPIIWLKIYFYLNKNIIYDANNIAKSFIFKKIFHMYQMQYKRKKITLFEETGVKFTIEDKFDGYVLSIKGWQE